MNRMGDTPAEKDSTGKLLDQELIQDPPVPSQESDTEPANFLSATARRVWREPRATWRTSITTRLPFLEPLWATSESVVSTLPEGWAEKLPLLLLGFLFSPRIFVFASAFATVAAFGYVAGSTASKQLSSFRRPSIDTSSGGQTEFTQDDSLRDLSIPPVISSALNGFINHIVRDFVNNWYQNINHSKSSDFPDAVFTTLRHSLLKLGVCAKDVRVASLSLPIYQSVVEHMREYRNFEKSSLPLDEYLAGNAISPFHKLRERTDIINHIRALSMQLTVEILPRAERSSPMVFNFVHEVLATSVLLPIVDMCSDSDWINRQMIAYLQKKEAKVTAKHLAAQEISKESPYEGDHIYVKVLEARGLPVIDASEVYCTLLCGVQTQKTKKVQAVATPVWLAEARFEPPCSQKGGSLEGVVVDIMSAKMIRDDVVGSVYLPLAALPKNKFVRKWFSIDTAESKYRGVNNAELLLEAMNISPVLEHSKSEVNESMARALRDPEATSTDDILLRSEGLVEFMQYMESIHASDYVQLYVMIDSFRRFSTLEGGQGQDSALKDDALVIVDTFFPMEGPSKITLLDSQVVASTRDRIVKGPTTECLIPLQDALKRVIHKRFLDGYKQSKFFQQYLEDIGHVAAAFDPPKTSIVSSETATVAEILELEQPPIALPASSPRNAPSSPTQQPSSPTKQSSPTRSVDSHTNSPSNASPVSVTASFDQNHDGAMKHSESEDVESKDIESEDPNDLPSRSLEAAANALDSLGRKDENYLDDVKAAIDSLREQICILDSMMRQLDSPEKLSELANSKLQLQAQVEELADMVAQEEKRHKGQNVMNLHNVKVNIMDMTAPEKDDKIIFNFAGNTHLKSTIYMVQIERMDGTGGWMVSKSYFDFLALHDQLLESFEQTRASNFPVKTRINGAKARETLGQDLERWLNQLLPESGINEFPAMQEFLKPENLRLQEVSAPSVATGAKMLGSLRTAGSLLRKVAVVTPMRAANFVATEVNAAVTGVAQGMKKGDLSSPKITRKVPTSVSVSSSLAGQSGDIDSLLVPARGSSLDDLPAAILDKPIEGANGRPSEQSETPEPRDVGDVLADSTSRSPASTLTSSRFEGELDEKNPALSDSELELVLDCVFGVIEEAFQLSDPDQWLRQKGLHMIKTILRRTYGTTISASIQKRLTAVRSPKSVASYIESLDKSLWPDDKWYSTTSPDQLPQPPRTEEQIADTKLEAKHLFLHSGLVDTLSRVVGKYNTVAGQTRIFNMLQHTELNRRLVTLVLDRMVRSLLGR
ncbi:PXA domain-containing protein [Phlyctochytrium arcticum]|nr:PXA domain-containing protein [Phlyctochytrium arcticum]